MTEGISEATAKLGYQFLHDLMLHQIMRCRLDSETPGSRLRQYAMITVMLDLHCSSKPMTVSNIVAVTGMTRGAVDDVLSSLEARGLVSAFWTKNAAGRGQAREYRITGQLSVDTTHLLDAIRHTEATSPQ